MSNVIEHPAVATRRKREATKKIVAGEMALRKLPWSLIETAMQLQGSDFLHYRFSPSLCQAARELQAALKKMDREMRKADDDDVPDRLSFDDIH
jgi:hypothetical protein